MSRKRVRRVELQGRNGQFVDQRDQPVAPVGNWQLRCDLEELEVTALGDTSAQWVKGLASLELRVGGGPRSARFRGDVQLQTGETVNVTLVLLESTMHVNGVEPAEASQALHNSLR